MKECDDSGVDHLFATEITASSAPPLIVVGLPRSGSSFLSHILSQIEDWYVFDDLYLGDKARDIRALGPLSDTQLDQLLEFLGWQIHARLKFGLYAVPKIEKSEIPDMAAALKATFSGTGATWTDLQKEWLLRLAGRNGCSHWGYKQPKAFRSIDTLRDSYPGARFLWLMRHPHDVLASYKHMEPSSQDGDPDQYHPVAHAIYWRMAAKAYFRARERLGSDVFFVGFDSLTTSPQTVAENLADFLGARRPARIEVPPRPNSSFSRQAPRKTVSGLEAKIINRICWPIASDMGFAPRSGTFSATDPLDLASRSLRFTRYQVANRILRRK
ncbi:sulfotransferase [Jannaschia sp. 2305UL9-9]|uniref:sulfotransferase family protein n=1 Tax=Jannaschia sp. 2305UL9-9 TaxID=3121638 RepID=UPI003529244F